MANLEETKSILNQEIENLERKIKTYGRGSFDTGFTGGNKKDRIISEHRNYIIEEMKKRGFKYSPKSAFGVTEHYFLPTF